MRQSSSGSRPQAWRVLLSLTVVTALLVAPALGQITNPNSYDPTTKDWASVISACLKVGRIEKRLGNFVTRAAFHDGLSVKLTGSGPRGGADASLFLTTTELMRPENTYDNFAATAGRVITRIANFYNVSVADTLAVCGVAAAITNGNPESGSARSWSPFRYSRLRVGRIDSGTPNPAGQLPPVTISVDDFLKWWADRGFTVEEASVLTTGTHSMIDNQICFRGRGNNPRDYCNPFEDRNCRDIKMFQFDHHLYVDSCTPGLYLEDPSRVPKADRFPPEEPIEQSSTEEFNSLRAEELCKFTSDIYRFSAIERLDRQRAGLDKDPPEEPSDDTFWENVPGECIKSDIPQVKANCPHPHRWLYTVLDARLGRVCQESDPRNASFSALKDVMRKFAGNNTAMQESYSKAYVKMVSRFANWGPRNFEILGRECPSGWVAKTGSVTDAQCANCTDPRNPCPYGCICATSFWNDIAVSDSLLDRNVSPSPQVNGATVPRISLLSPPGSISVGDSSGIFDTNTNNFPSTILGGTPRSPYRTTCPTRDGNSFDVEGYPATPFMMTPFRDEFKNPPVKTPIGRQCRDIPQAGGAPHCMDAYEINVEEKQLSPFSNAIPACANKPTWFMTYDGTVPGPTIVAPSGTETLVRFNNKIRGDFFTTGQYPCDPKFGRPFGRPISIHLHGSASLPPYDGWADDVTCTGESKDYIYPNNRATTAWYHDHAAAITAPNAYRGMAAMYMVTDDNTKGSTCKQPFNLDGMEERIMMLADKVLDSDCQLRFSKLREHRNNLYGDINTVNGIPWPVMRLEPKAYSFRILNAGPSRPYVLRLRTRTGSNRHHRVCRVVGGDGGWRQTATSTSLPERGLYLGVAERYHVVCDFSSLEGEELYWTNEKDDKFFKDVPMFCFSHLIAKVVVSRTASAPVVRFNPDLQLRDRPLHTLLTESDIAVARERASRGEYDRRLKFGRRHGHWVINGDGWENFKLAAADVGQNTAELWLLDTGGSWFHPVHIHLIDFFILQRNDARGVQVFEQMTPKDVVMLGPGQKLWVIARFGPHRGDYMFHCHNLVHEDNDMMRAFRTNKESRFFNSNPQFMRALGGTFDTIYSNWGYNNPEYPEVAAKQGLPAITDEYIKTMVNKNLYKIFYPFPNDGNDLTTPSNPWIWTCPAVGGSSTPSNPPPTPTPPPRTPPPPPRFCGLLARLRGQC